MLALPQAPVKHRKSIRNWVNGTKPLVRSESLCFLEGFHEDDFVALNAGDSDEGALEALFYWLLRALPKISSVV